jgi:hypothetical protein
MSQKLLKENVALKKIELSLKLQGKLFDAKFLNCKNCKFCWSNHPYGMSRPKPWSETIYNYTKNQYEPNPEPKPEKTRWNCYKYKGTPYHAYLRFKVVRFNAEGQEVPRTHYTNEKGEWTNALKVGEFEKLVLKRPGTYYQSCVCRRFEACPR